MAIRYELGNSVLASDRFRTLIAASVDMKCTANVRNRIGPVIRQDRLQNLYLPVTEGHSPPPLYCRLSAHTATGGTRQSSAAPTAHDVSSCARTRILGHHSQR